MKVEKLLKIYHKLPEEKKAILRLKALLYFKTPIEILRSCFANLEYLFPVRRLITPQEFTSHIEVLKSLKLLDRDNLIPQTLIHSLTVDTLNSERAEDYLKSIEFISDKMGARFYNSISGFEKNVNDLRLAIYTSNTEDFEKAIRKHPTDYYMNFFRQLFLTEPLDIEWLKLRPIMAQQLILHLKLFSFCLTGEGIEDITALLSYYQPLREKKEFANLDKTFLLYDILSGNVIKAMQTLEKVSRDLLFPEALQGTLAFLTQQNDKSIIFFEEAIKALKKATKKKKVFLNNQESLFYSLALLCSQDRQNYKKLETLLDGILQQYLENSQAFRVLQKVLWRLQGLESKILPESTFTLGLKYIDPLSSAIIILGEYWFDSQKVNLEACKTQFEKYKGLLPLIAKIFAEILHKEDPGNQEYEAYLAQENFRGLISFINIIHMGEKWERVLSNLDHFFEQQASSLSITTKRLAWFFDPKTRAIEVVEQSFKPKGGWSSGRPISLKRFHDEDPKLDYLTEEDKKCIKTLRSHRSYGWGGGTYYEWDSIKTPLALIGHPCVFHADNPALRLELVESTPELVIKQQDEDKFHISLSHVAYQEKIFVEAETPTRYRIVYFPQSMVPLTEILGNQGIKVPAKAKDHIVSIIQKASPIVPIHSEVETADIRAIEGDLTPCLQITPLDQGLKVNLLVRPFGDQGPYFRPGQGRNSPIIVLDSQQLKANRSLDNERMKADTVISACSYLQLNNDGSDEWSIEDPEECLEVLSNLQDLKEPIKFEWPEGKKFSVTNSSSFDHLSLKISQNRDWFDVKGSLKVDEDTVVEFRHLLELLDCAQGRFIPLEGNKFIALTSHFKKQLQELKALTEETKDGCRIHTLGGLALKSFVDKVRHVKGDQGWINKLKSFEEAENYQPKLPATLQAELREYQRQGFEWISRLAYLGLGACLADDMGLGKTLQALAVMLNQAPKGPCLVVAPTSVCHNWVSEIAKFAPTLTIHSLADTKREVVISSLQAMDVLVCSYALLQQESELLGAKQWQMIVLDEAQAIKNPSTKRFQAAIRLQSQLKLALTGTPIENNLEEIWSLFRFIAPGLLGSREVFQKRFIISRDKEKICRNSLKNLIQMFILRRTKNKVLQELPPRTEQTIFVEMSSEEQGFYEALKQKALENIYNLQEEGKRKIHILAEITRLRRACCHPSLAHKDIVLPSSKLKAFFHLVDELLQNNHQALVFSQYVGYLELVRQELDQRKISYQYLDGSTPASARKEQVQAFQEGKSSLFLLSLKAGGAGLNLTAADYVIHLDPWWNPAVEDQASDRAHRLGQKRPVTIYRLIVQNTIEEKILSLHKDKRDMADELLEGTHTPSKMTEAELINLISSEAIAA